MCHSFHQVKKKHMPSFKVFNTIIILSVWVLVTPPLTIPSSTNKYTSQRYGQDCPFTCFILAWHIYFFSWYVNAVTKLRLNTHNSDQCFPMKPIRHNQYSHQQQHYFTLNKCKDSQCCFTVPLFGWNTYKPSWVNSTIDLKRNVPYKQAVLTKTKATAASMPPASFWWARQMMHWWEQLMAKPHSYYFTTLLEILVE